jgi:quercetin dioxygenase-like cupin family protein
MFKMEIETLCTRRSFAGNIKSVSSPVLRYDLPSTIMKMKDNDDWKRGELKSLILVNSPAKKVVLTIMHNRTEVDSFQSGDSVTIQIISGKMKIQTIGDAVFLKEGQILVLHNKEKFVLTALEESSFMLTIITGALMS